MRRYLFGALILVLGRLNSQAFGEYSDQNLNYKDPYFSLDISEDINDHDMSTASHRDEEDDREAQENVGQKYGDGYFGENLPGGFESDPYQPRDDVAYWESIYGTEDVPDFEVPPPIDGDSVFMGIDDLTNAWEDLDVEEGAIPWKRDAEKTESDLERATSSVKQTRRNFENSQSSGNLDYHSMMTDVYQPHFYEQNSGRALKTSSSFEDDQNERLYGSRMTYSSNFEPETAQASYNVRRAENGDIDVEDSEDVEREMKSELEFTGRYPVAVESRSIQSTHSLSNSKRKVIQAKKDLINVATAGGSRVEVGDAVHRTIEAKKDFIDSVISAKASAIQHKKELLHSITGHDHSYDYFGNSRFPGHIHSQDRLESVLDSKQKIIQAKKDLIHNSAVDSKAELTDAVIRALDAKKETVDSLLSTGARIDDTMIEAKKGLIDSVISAKAAAIQNKKEHLHSTGGFDHGHSYSGHSRISESIGSQGTFQSVIDSKRKVIQAKKDLICGVGSRAELTDAIVKTLDAKRGFVDSLLATKTGMVHNEREFGHSTCCSTSTAENSFASVKSKSKVSGESHTNVHSGSIHGHQKLHETEHSSSGSTIIQGKTSSLHLGSSAAGNIAVEKEVGVHRNEGASLKSKSQVSGESHADLHSGSNHDHHKLHETEHSSSGSTITQGKTSSLHSSSSAAGKIAVQKEIGVHRNEGASVKSKSQVSGESQANLHSGSIHDHHKLHQTEHSSSHTTIQNKPSSLHSGSSVAGNIGVEGKVGVASSSSHSDYKEKSSLVLNKEIESRTQISSSLKSGQSGVHPSENPHQINSPKAENSKVGFSTDVKTNQVKQSSPHSSLSEAGNIAIEADVGIASSLSNSNQKSEGSLTFSKKIEGSGKISTGQKQGLIVSQNKTHSSKSSDQFNSSDSEIENVSDSSSEETRKKESESKIIGIKTSNELGEISGTKNENTDLKSSIGEEITLFKSLGEGNVIHYSLKSNTQAETKVGEKSLSKSEKECAALGTEEIFGIDHKNDRQSIHKECAPGQCGITGKLHVELDTKGKIDFQHQNEQKTIVESKISQNHGYHKNDEEDKVSFQSPASEAVIVDTGFVGEKSKESLKHENHDSNFQGNTESKIVVNVIEKTPDIDDHLVVDEGDQQTKAISYTKDSELGGKVEYGLSDTGSEDASSHLEEGGSHREEELVERESVGDKSEVELETQIGGGGEIDTKQDSIAFEKSSNYIIKSKIDEAHEAVTQNEEANDSAIEHNARHQVTVKFDNLENNSSYGEHESSTYERKFGEQCPIADYHLGESHKKGKISHFQLSGGSLDALLPEDVEELEAHRAFSNAHCRLINLDVNCSGMTAFMKPECQELNAKLWHSQDSEAPITLWTVKTYLNHGQELAIEMQTRAKWLCDQGLVPKLHTPSMLHLINNFATQNIVEINQASECSLFGTKLLQRRLSSHFDVTPNTFVAFLQHHSFRVIGTGLCYDRPKRCPTDQMYRTFDGSCNNPNHPTWGQSNTAFARILPARYSDGVHQPPKSVTGTELPNPRVLSTRCCSRKLVRNRKITLALSQWGQLLSHDFALQTIDQTIDGGIQCCADGKRQLPKSLQHHSCLPIDIPVNDEFYSKFELRCMNFVRSMTISREDCTLGPADQLNTVTSYLDASPLYGSNKQTCDRLRTFKHGRMLAVIRRGRQLLPTMTNRTRFCDAMSPTEVCYLAGDVRVNQNPQLAILQTLLLREHNRLANQLTLLNPHWEDERVFQEARKIVIAELQCITFDEWLPLVIGKQYCQRHRLISRNRDMMSQDYDPRIKASTINAFSTAVFRSFHSMVEGNIDLCPANREISHTLRLSNHFFRPQIIERSNNLDDLIRGLVSQPMQEADESFHPEITEYLFRSRNEFGLDLEAIDVQRGRDHGLSCYNAYREICGLPRAKDFDDLAREISRKNIETLKRTYAHVEDIDLIVGVVMENASPGSLLGPVARCLIGEQFYRSKVGDRYFYDVLDQPHSFTREQFKQIKKRSFAKLLCDTADDLREIQPRAFKMISPKNPLTCCSALPEMDLSPWQEVDC